MESSQVTLIFFFLIIIAIILKPTRNPGVPWHVGSISYSSEFYSVQTNFTSN